MNLEKLKELALTLPDSVKQNALDLIERMGEKIEGIGDTPISWRAQTTRLVQAMSDRSKLPKGANIGDILLGESILNQPCDVIPLRSWKARQYWSPDKDEAKVLCSSPDAILGYQGTECKKCPHSVFDEESRKTECNTMVVVMVVKADLSDVFMVNFSKTGYKTGGEWQGLMKKAGVATYRRVYGLVSKDSKEYKNVSNIAIETYSGEKRDTPAELLPFITELFNQVGAERKDHVDNFHKIVLSRKQDPSLLANAAGADSEVVLIGTDAPVEVASEAAPAAKTSKLAGKYQV